MPEPDPIAALAVGLAADAKVARTRKLKDKPQPEPEPFNAGSAQLRAYRVARRDGVSLEDAVAASNGAISEAEARLIDKGDAENPPPPEAFVLLEVAPSEATEDAPDPVPDAPGDDADTVFQRRLDRLTNLAMAAEFEAGTLFGDLRDLVLDLFKHRPKLWSAMPPSDQRDLIRHVEGVVKQVLERLVLVVAQEDSVTIEATLLPAFTVKGEAVEAKLKIDQVDGDGVLDVYRLAGHKVVVIDAAAKRFMSGRRDVDPGQDQVEMPFADPAPAPLAHPADDSDLVDAAETPGSEAEWGVFDQDRQEWLIDEEGGDEGWTSARGDAGRWAYDRATELAHDFADGGEAVKARQLAD